jgi:hypothetical protein
VGKDCFTTSKRLQVASAIEGFFPKKGKLRLFHDTKFLVSNSAFQRAAHYEPVALPGNMKC